MQINVLIAVSVFFTLPVVCWKTPEQIFKWYGLHYDSESEYEFVRYETFDYEKYDDNLLLTEECDAAQQECYKYLRCNDHCDYLVSKWSQRKERWDPEQSSINPCEIMEMKCYGVNNDEIAHHLNDDFYGF